MDERMPVEKQGKITYWHNMCYCSLEEMIQGKKGSIALEVALNHLPMRPDFVVRLDDTALVQDHPILGGFRKYNIVEYVSPNCSLHINNFKRGIVYSIMHQIRDNSKDHCMHESAITYVTSQRPDRTFKRLREMGLIMVKDTPIKGVYQLKGFIIPVQFVVLNKMVDLEYLYPFAPFVRGGKRREALEMLRDMALRNPKNEVLKQFINYSFKEGAVDKNEWKEVFGMEKISAKARELLDAARESWIGEELLEEGKKIGLEVGEKRGMQLGENEGKIEGKIEVIKRGLMNGLPVSVLAMLTGFNEEDILKISYH